MPKMLVVYYMIMGFGSVGAAMSIILHDWTALYWQLTSVWLAFLLSEEPNA